MMGKISREKAIELHREMWNWLAETGAAKKSDWPLWEEVEDSYGPISCHCFACEVAEDEIKTGRDDFAFTVGYIRCQCCPLDWTDDGNFPDNCVMGSDSEEGLYDKWARAADEEKKKLAKKIAELPEKEERHDPA